jgi:hypothetical protein
VHVIKALPIHQAHGVVLIGETFEVMSFVLKHALMQIAGHSNVKCAAGTALQDVNVKSVLAPHARDLKLRFRESLCALSPQFVVIREERKVPRLRQEIASLTPDFARDDRVKGAVPE